MTVEFDESLNPSPPLVSPLMDDDDIHQIVGGRSTPSRVTIGEPVAPGCEDRNDETDSP